ncbi:hypothetical protein [Emergencia timonensis]
MKDKSSVSIHPKLRRSHRVPHTKALYTSQSWTMKEDTKWT